MQPPLLELFNTIFIFVLWHFRQASDTCLHQIKVIPWSTLISIQAHTALHDEVYLRPLSHCEEALSGSTVEGKFGPKRSHEQQNVGPK